MKTWFFTEDAYPYLPDPSQYDSIRVDLPSRLYDPKKAPSCTAFIWICGATPKSVDWRSCSTSITRRPPVLCRPPR